jgi:hypothetical protein
MLVEPNPSALPRGPPAPSSPSAPLVSTIPCPGYRSGPHRQVRPRAGPGIFGRMLHNARPHRVPLHVAQCCPQMARTEHAGEESVLPQMTRAPGARIVVLRIPPVYPAQQDAKRVLLRRHGNQVHMVAHQAVAKYADSGVTEIFL